jgi:PAS domain S-box-containing protein
MSRDSEPSETELSAPTEVPGAAGVRTVASAAAAGADMDLYRLLVASVRDYAIFALDHTGHILSWNLGAERLKGYTAAEIIGRHFSTFYLPEEVASGHPERQLRNAARTGSVEDEGWRVRKDGSRFWANVVITALRNAEGELIGFAKVTRDLTERRNTEQRAIEDARRVAEVEAANRAKSEFLTSLSHELRTPLNAIGGYTELLALGVRGPVNDAQKQDLERIRQSQQHLLILVNDLLNYTRLEGGGIAYRFESVPLGDALDNMEAMIRPQAEAKDLSFEVTSCPPDTAVLADAARLQQILLNLVSNAVKFTPAGGRVSVSCTSTGEQLVLRVSDTGPGIPASERETIFEPFTQPGRSYTSPQEGVGLGLAISRDLARALGGDLKVSSTAQAGATFELTLQRAGSAGPDAL